MIAVFAHLGFSALEVVGWRVQCGRLEAAYRDETNGCYVTRSSESILGGSPVVQVVGCHLLHHRSVWPAGLEH